MAQPKSSHMSLIAASALTGVLGVTAIGFLSSFYGWPLYLELLSHFQLQYFVLSAIGVVVVGLTRRPIAFLMTLACTAALATQIFSWYLPPTFLNAARSDLRVLVTNVNTRNQEYEKVLAFVQAAEPDLALFQEVNSRWIESLNVLLADLPYAVGEARSDNFGMVLYSRFPLEDVQVRQFSEASTPSIVATIATNDYPIAIVGTHPLPPLQGNYFQSRNQQLEQVAAYLQTVEYPKVVLGDLNITMWSPYYRRFVRQAAVGNARQGFGILPSWPTPALTEFKALPAWLTPFLSIPIDHCLLSSDIEVSQIQTGPNVGSDHRPIVADLKFSSP